MTESARAIPPGYGEVSIYLIVDGASAALEFYKHAFDARERMRVVGPDGRVQHAEFLIGKSVFMLAVEFPDMGVRGPRHYRGSPVFIHLYVEDVDARFQQAIRAGAVVARPVVDQFYGDRSGILTDPYGHVWTLATHKEDVPPDELRHRFDRAVRNPPG